MFVCFFQFIFWRQKGACFCLPMYLYSTSVFHLYSFRYPSEVSLLRILQLGSLFQYFRPENDMKTKMKAAFLQEQVNRINCIPSTFTIRKKTCIFTSSIQKKGKVTSLIQLQQLIESRSEEDSKRCCLIKNKIKGNLANMYLDYIWAFNQGLE